MKKPEKFEDFCESMTQPYSSAKQYFDDIILKIDVYHDTTYFYEFYESLESKKQDTVYCNLQRLYDVTKDSNDETEKRIISKFKDLKRRQSKNIDDVDDIKVDLENFISKTTELLSEYNAESIKGHKLGVLNQLLATADNVRRNKDSVEISVCEDKCNKHNNDLNQLKSTQIKVFYLSLLATTVITAFVCLAITYIYAKVGNEAFIKFIEENFWAVIGFPIITAIVMYIVHKIINLQK